MGEGVGGMVEDMEYPGVVLEEHVEIPGVNFRKTEFPGMIKKKVM